MAKDIPEDREYEGLPLSSEPSQIPDLGANIGLGLLALHDHYSQAKLAGVDADSRNFTLLLRNLQANCVQASLMEVAVAREPGILGLRIGENSTCSILIDGDVIHPGHTACIDVPVLTTPQMLDRLGWSLGICSRLTSKVPKIAFMRVLRAGWLM